MGKRLLSVPRYPLRLTLIVTILTTLNSPILIAQSQNSVDAYDAIEKYILEFQRLSWRAGHAEVVRYPTVRFEDMEKNTIAACVLLAPGSPYIKINKDNWINLSDLEREQTIFHELGHCMLGRGHEEDKSESIMYPYAISEEEYKLNRAKFIEELFRNAKDY
jgi:hypothetical protein